MLPSANKKIKTGVDWQFALLVLFLTLLGLLFIADASAPQALKFFNNRFYFARQQLIWSLIGVVLFVLFSKINYKFWFRYAGVIFLLNVLSLILVVTPAFGFKALGARRWLNFGFFSFQPSELAKFALILYFARLSELKKSFWNFVIPLIFVCFLIMLEPDLGTTLVVAAIGILQIFVSGVNFSYFLTLVFASLVSGIVLIISSSYRRVRLMTFLAQAADPLGHGYHITQVLISLGLGGLFGVGLGESSQKYLFLPEAATDSIFAVIAEELGFIGSLALIFIFVYLVYRALKISVSSPDAFSKVVTFGFAVWIGSQTILNLGSMTALTPLTGIPLPLISYGGSSLVMLLSLAGIILNISRYRQESLILRGARRRLVLNKR
jgi:cell division protein FtsW